MTCACFSAFAPKIAANDAGFAWEYPGHNSSYFQHFHSFLGVSYLAQLRNTLFIYSEPKSCFTFHIRGISLCQIWLVWGQNRKVTIWTKETGYWSRRLTLCLQCNSCIFSCCLWTTQFEHHFFHALFISANTITRGVSPGQRLCCPALLLLVTKKLSCVLVENPEILPIQLTAISFRKGDTS